MSIVKLPLCLDCGVPHVPEDVAERVRSGESITIEIIAGSGVAQNVLKHGTGAINVDATRVQTADKWAATGQRSAPSTSLQGGVDGSLNISVSETHEHGRWPPNLLLSHVGGPNGCKPTGEVRRVKGITGGKNPVRGNGVHAEAKGHQTPGRAQTYHDYADPDGTEPQEVWECVAGCPIHLLDEMSGQDKSRPQGRPSIGTQKPQGSTSFAGENSGIGYTDKGGASRFFPRFEGGSDAIQVDSDRTASGIFQTQQVEAGANAGAASGKTLRTSANAPEEKQPVELEAPFRLCEICENPIRNHTRYSIMRECQEGKQNTSPSHASVAVPSLNPERRRAVSAPENVPEPCDTSRASANGVRLSTRPTGESNGSVLPDAPEQGSHTTEGRNHSESMPATNAESDSGRGPETSENIAQESALTTLEEQLVQRVSGAANLCNSCVIAIAQRLALCVAEKSISIRGLDYMPTFKSSILTQSLVSFVGPWASTGTIPTTASLSILFGYVRAAIAEYTAVASDGVLSGHPGFKYQSKSSRRERNAGLEGMPEKTNDWQRATSGLSQGKNPRTGERSGTTMGPRANHHPTVKPIALMRWLVRLVTPPGGTVLDPFMGSGSTGCAAVQEGFNFIGIEAEPEYAEIARRRIAHWSGESSERLEPKNGHTETPLETLF